MPRLPNKSSKAQQLSTPSNRATLYWSCWDSSTTVASLVHEALDRWTVDRGIRHHQSPVTEQLSSVQTLGLAVWAVWEHGVIDLICQSIVRLRESHQATVVVVFVNDSCTEQSSHLVQAGAQLVVQSLDRIQRAIAILAESIPLSYHDTNRLTYGLLQRQELSESS